MLFLSYGCHFAIVAVALLSLKNNPKFPAVLSNSLTRSSSFLVESIGFSMYTIISSAVTVLLPSFQFGFISFSCLISMARTSNTMLNRSGESRHPCLVP